MGRISKRKGRGFIGKKKWEVLGQAVQHHTNEVQPNVTQGTPVAEASSSKQNEQPRNISAEKIANSDFNTMTPLNGPVTRQIRRKLGMLDSKRPLVERATGTKLLDVSLLQDCLNLATICASCKSAKSRIAIFQKNLERNGLAEALVLRCLSCGAETPFNTSKKLPGKRGAFEVNRKSVLAFCSRQRLVKFCTKFDLPPPMNKKPYNQHLKECEKVFTKETEKKLSSAASRLKKIIAPEDPSKVITWIDGKEVTKISITVDGTWQKRGHTSKIGVVFILSVRSGEVLDYEVLSHICHECLAHKNLDKSSDSYKNWWKVHAQSCQINHTGSSGGMETEGAIAMFKRSLEKHRLVYTKFVGDGDSSCYGSVNKAMNEIYGTDYPVSKEECVGHVQKRMGSALTEFKKSMKGKKLSDGKGVGGAGRLTDDVVKKIQNYYGFAIRQNKGNMMGMLTAIKAIKHHVIQEPCKSLAIQHRYCPSGKSSWCKYQKDAAIGTESYNETGRLPHVFMEELGPIFERLSDKELLGRCQLGLTQNQNESLNGVLWSNIPKTLFLGKRRVTIAVCEAISVFNTGSAAKAVLMENIGLSVGENVYRALRKEDNQRILSAAQKISKKYRLRRKEIKFGKKRMAKLSSKVAYKAGSFGTDVLPEHAIVKVKQSKKRKMRKEVGKKVKTTADFVNESSDQLKITFVPDEEIALIQSKKRK